MLVLSGKRLKEIITILTHDLLSEIFMLAVPLSGHTGQATVKALPLLHTLTLDKGEMQETMEAWRTGVTVTFILSFH